MGTVLFYALCWIGMALLGVINGILREKTYGKRLSELRAPQLSTLIAIVLFGFYIWTLTCIRPLQSGSQALTVGIMWFGMTVLFEFVFGHYVAGHSWGRLLRDYNLSKGRLWSLVLIFVTLSPYVIHQIRKLTV